MAHCMFDAMYHRATSLDIFNAMAYRIEYAMWHRATSLNIFSAMAYRIEYAMYHRATLSRKYFYSFSAHTIRFIVSSRSTR